MKLNTQAIRYLSGEDWRVLTAVEQGSKNHEIVPTPLIQQIAGLRGDSGVHKCISTLAKVGLIAKVRNAKYDGYRLTYGGLDYLALNTHRRSDVIFSLGNQIGVGKESDIYVTAAQSGDRQVLKLHRLGRISFRSVKSNRDYLRNRTTGSWMYLSRLAAQKEHAFMKVLHREGFPVPKPIAWNRHTIVMEFIDAFPLRMIDSVPEPNKLYAELVELIVGLGRRGLIHGDFNEYNILIKEDEQPGGRIKLVPIVIDFPQMVSTNHVNADMYFDRDVACIKKYFERKFKYTFDEKGPFLKDVLEKVDREKRLDVEVEASGFSRQQAKALERYVNVIEETRDGKDEVNGKEVEEDEEQEEQDEDEEPDFDHHSQTFEEHLETDLTPLDVDAKGGRPVQRMTTMDFSLSPLLISEASHTASSLQVKKKAAGWAV